MSRTRPVEASVESARRGADVAPGSRQRKASIPRRTFLKNSVLWGASALGAAADWKTIARKNLTLAVHSAPYSKLPLEEASRKMRADGFSGLVTDYRFADVRLDPLAPDWAAAEKITSTLQRHGLHIAAISGYYNVVSPDAAQRRRGEACMEFFLTHWRRLGCRIVSTATGTFNAKSPWIAAPENATEKAYLECRDALARLASLAERSGAVLSIEPYWQNVIDCIDRTVRLLREVSSPALKLVMDPCNYFRREDLPRMQPMLEEMFRRLGDQIVIAHAKDVKASEQGTDLPAAGRGVLDYPLYLRLLAGLNRPMDLVVEHLTLDDVPRTIDFVRRQY